VRVLLTVLFSIDLTTGEIATAELLTGYARDSPYLVNVSAEADFPPRVTFTLVAILIRRLEPDDLRPFFIRPGSDGEEFSFEKVRQRVVIQDTIRYNFYSAMRSVDRCRGALLR